MKTFLKPLFLVFVVCFITNDILAQTKLSVQGVIRLSDGNAIEDGLYPITFKLYDAETGGNELWSETQAQLKVTSGIYSTILGEVTPLDLEFDAFYFLSLTVEGEELLPRAPLTSAPYSNSVLGFDNVFPSTGDIGIGTLVPEEKVDIEGNLKVDSIFAEGDIFAKNIHLQYKGTFTLTNVPSGTSYREVTIPAVPSSYAGDAGSIVIIVCSFGSAGTSAPVMQARVGSSTKLALYINNVNGGSSNIYRYNYVILPL